MICLLPRRTALVARAAVNGRDGIVTPTAERMTPYQTPRREPHPVNDAKAGNRLARIHRTRWREAARSANERRKQSPVGGQDSQREFDGGGRRVSLLAASWDHVAAA